MNQYTFEYWYRYADEREDFFQVIISSNTEEEARKEVKGIRRCVFGIKLLEINGIKVIKTQNN